MHGSEFLWSTAMGCNFSFILVPSWVNFSNRYMYGWSKIVHHGTWMGLTSYTVVHGWVTFPSKLVRGWVMGGGTSKFPDAHPYPDQSWVPPRVQEPVLHTVQLFMHVSFHAQMAVDASGLCTWWITFNFDHRKTQIPQMAPHAEKKIWCRCLVSPNFYIYGKHTFKIHGNAF